MRLHWPDCLNTRDLGGLPATSGSRIRPGALVRSDYLCRLTPAGEAALRAHGISRIVDLRSPDEVGSEPGPFADDELYVNTPFIDEVADRARDPDSETSLLDIYRGSMDRNGRCIADALEAIALAPPGGVLVHCFAGKDRTGVLIALALRTVGVPDDEIAVDYALTEEYLRDRHRELLAAESDETARELLREMNSSRAETMVGLLTYLDEQYGGTVPYLTTIGFTDAHVAALRDRLLES